MESDFSLPFHRDITARISRRTKITRIIEIAILYHGRTVLEKSRKHFGRWKLFEMVQRTLVAAYNWYSASQVGATKESLFLKIDLQITFYSNSIHMYIRMNELFVPVRVSLYVLNNGRWGRRFVGVLDLLLRFRRSRIRRWSFLHGRLQAEKFYHWLKFYRKNILTFISRIVVSCGKHTCILIVIGKLKNVNWCTLL